MVLYHAPTTNADRSAVAATTLEAAPPSPLPSRSFLPASDEDADTVLPALAKTASQNGAPSPFFFFTTREVETPLRCGVEIPRRLSLVQGMAPPHLRGDPCEANLPGLFPTKMAGLRSTSEPPGLFPAKCDSAGLQSIFCASSTLNLFLQHLNVEANATRAIEEPSSVEGSSPTMLRPGLQATDHLGRWNHSTTGVVKPHPKSARPNLKTSSSGPQTGAKSRCRRPSKSLIDRLGAESPTMFLEPGMKF